MASDTKTSVESLKFTLDVEDDWPPVGIECLPFQKTEVGYKLTTAPLFVKDLSVDDIISARLADANLVRDWQHVYRSKRTTIWILRKQRTNEINVVLTKLRSIGCNSVSLEQFGCYSVDVPEDIDIEVVDELLSTLDDKAVAIAYPSMRHPE